MAFHTCHLGRTKKRNGGSSTTIKINDMETGKKKLGVALVGLGEYSTGQLGPALTKTKHCYLAGIVSGDPDKQQKWKAQYDLKTENILDYGNFDMLASRRDIDIVYIVLPNAMHASYAIRAAQAGKHVIVEKPMAISPEECNEIIAVCHDAGVKLGIGYRLHYDRFNQEMIRLGQNEVFGKVQKIIADNSMKMTEKDQWRLNRELSGGGPLVNNGIYCIQAAIYVTGQLPLRVRAQFDPVTDAEMFSSVEEGISWEMDLVNGISVSCTSSYSRDGNQLRAEAERGWFELAPAYEYGGLKGSTSEGRINLRNRFQQVAQLDDFAISVKKNTAPRLSGEMGLRDVQLIEAIYKAATTGEEIDPRFTIHHEPMEID